MDNLYKNIFNDGFTETKDNENLIKEGFTEIDPFCSEKEKDKKRQDMNQKILLENIRNKKKTDSENLKRKGIK